MDDLKFACPHCQQPLALPASQAGAMVVCPHANCGCQVRVPPAAAQPVAAAIRAPPPMPGASGSPGAAPSLPPLPKNRQATASMALAISGFVLVCVGTPLSIAAIVLGLLALKAPADAYGRRPGRTQAVVGISLGSGGLLLGLVIAILVALVTPALQMARERGHHQACANNLKQIGAALAMYADDYQGAYPATLAALDHNAILTTGEVYHCPDMKGRLAEYGSALASGRLGTDYDYYGTGLVLNVTIPATVIPANVILAADHEHNHPGRHPWTNVLFADGHVEGVNAASLREALAANGHWRLGTDVARELAAAQTHGGTSPPAARQ